MTNFDYLKEEPQYNAFSNVAISAERIILADPQASIINSRRAMEFAVKWIYSVDKRLDPPYQETLVSLMGAEDFRQFVGNDIYRRMDYIRRCGNDTATERLMNRKFIVDSMVYWAKEYHIDGFRFDPMTISGVNIEVKYIAFSDRARS